LCVSIWTGGRHLRIGGDGGRAVATSSLYLAARLDIGAQADRIRWFPCWMKMASPSRGRRQKKTIEAAGKSSETSVTNLPDAVGEMRHHI